MPVSVCFLKPNWINDISQVDWNLVATDMEISNGATARMHWVRFKQLMEGAPRGKLNADTNRVAKPKPKAKTKAKPKGKTGVKGEDSEKEEEITKEEEE